MTGDSGRRTDVQWRRTHDDRMEGTMSHMPDTPQPEPRAGLLGTTGGRALIAASVLILVAAGAVAASYLVRPSATGQSPVASATATPTPSAMPSATASPTPGETAAGCPAVRATRS
jgi:hypothetical protein